jgi:hypothetical protein
MPVVSAVLALVLVGGGIALVTRGRTWWARLAGVVPIVVVAGVSLAMFIDSLERPGQIRQAQVRAFLEGGWCEPTEIKVEPHGPRDATVSGCGRSQQLCARSYPPDPKLNPIYLAKPGICSSADIAWPPQ